jgi:O-succinylbenzoic acid--CoA ligase
MAATTVGTVQTGRTDGGAAEARGAATGISGTRAVRVLRCDGSVRAVRLVARALVVALDGGPAVLPVPDAAVVERDRLLTAAAPDAGTDAALLVATSGSAGEPKVVELSASALIASARATHDRLGGPGGWLLALPVRHIAGLQVLVRSELAGVEPVVLDLSGGFRAEAFAAAAAAVSGRLGRRYTALVPTQLTRLLDAGGRALDALRGFDAVLLGGAAAGPGLVERAVRSGVRVVTTYGMTETAGGCVYDGVALPGVRVRVDAERRVHLAGPMLADGYRLRPELTAAAFAGGWFRTGDVGRIQADGTLDVLGRADDLIVTGGEKVPPALVERALDASPTVAESCVVGIADAHWGQLVAAAVVAAPGSAPDVAELRASVRERVGPTAVPKLVEVVPSLPTRGIGKVDRDAVQRYLTERHVERSRSV